ncbi:MAG: hypothetical protein M1829_001497 [Trizodia sp. TS-e1964]|nr:MAG: hypothetical protein M1829_001497 [Trizodia sp. TS-e1964]
MNARITNLPSDAYYISDFISSAEEDFILNKISTAPITRWTNLSHRRLQTYPSSLAANNTLLAAPLPSWLASPILPRLREGLDAFSGSPHNGPNHVLINEYNPGEGIMPHEDGAAYWPVVATISLGAPIVLEITKKRVEQQEEPRNEGVFGRILLEPRSLLVLTNDMYSNYLHGIAEVSLDGNLGPASISNWALLGSPQSYVSGSYIRRQRTSLTYRDVLNVSKLGNHFKLYNN